MKRPKIKLEKDVLDQFLEAIAFVSLIVLVIIPIVYYYQLPEKIPLHFGADGTADRFGDRSSIWLVPIIGCIMVIGLFMLNKRPVFFALTLSPILYFLIKAFPKK